MSDILIRGMEMPTSCFDNVMLCNDGRVFLYQNGEWVKSGTAVPVPQHGRLIDADALIDKVIAKYLNFERNGKLVFAAAEIKQDICDLISDASTIIEAEEGE